MINKDNNQNSNIYLAVSIKITARNTPRSIWNGSIPGCIPEREQANKPDYILLTSGLFNT
jgi:hypothetical protein